jgi:hypothetical protein
MNRPADQRPGAVPRWVKVLAAAFACILLLFVVLHLSGNTTGAWLHGGGAHGGQ